MSIVITVGAGAHRHPRRVRVRVPELPAPRSALRHVPRHADGPGRGHVLHEHRHHPASLGWYDTYAALAVPFLATGFGAFLLRQSFLTVPRDLRDAAALDGYGHWRFHDAGRGAARPARDRGDGAVRVPRRLEPVSLAARSPRRTTRLRTVQIGLKSAHRPRRSTRSTSPTPVRCSQSHRIAILLLLFSKQLVRGLMAGAVKG